LRGVLDVDTHLNQTVRFIDSHTAGEPTRVIVSGIPDLGDGSLLEQCRQFDCRHVGFRTFTVCEPRGSDILVGALLLPAKDPANLCGVIYYNTIGSLGMCGHGTIGLLATLAHHDQLPPGEYGIETPVGTVRVVLHDRHRVTVRNVKSYRLIHNITIDVPNIGTVTGDVAWGGNWFFLTHLPGVELTLQNVERLTQLSKAIKKTLQENNITGDGAEIDHIELYGPAADSNNHARNFVLCPGGAYDRSPCGTGTSAKLACLAADGHLKPGAIWRQESILGTVFEGSYAAGEGGIMPSITGSAYVTAVGELWNDADDPLRWSTR
jgi:4-hydroxyproline epimerase